MALRNIHTDIKSALIENKSLNVFHLVKFEKPSNLPVEGTKSTDYVYLTDAFHDAVYDGNTYTAGGLLKIGSIQETIEAKAANINLEISAAKLGANVIANVTCSSIQENSTGTLTVDISFFNSGFYTGDVVKLTSRSDPGTIYLARIEKLYSSGTLVDVTPIDTAIPSLNNTSFAISYANPEVSALLSSEGSDLNYTNYVNRSVEILRVYSDSVDGSWIGDPVLLFKGIISKGTINHKASGGSKVIWNVTSHWADFVRVQGRLTSDENHRALNASGRPDPSATIFPAYAGDKGFEHADTALNVTATYTGFDTRYKQVRRGGFAGFVGLKKLVEEKYEVQRELDLSLNLSAKFLPVIYGVQKVDPIPVFADIVITEDTTSTTGSTTLYMANALCEGPIGGIYDIYVGDKSLICKNQADVDVRGSSNTTDIPCLGRMETGEVLAGGYKYSYAFDIANAEESIREENEVYENPQNFPDSILTFSESLPPRNPNYTDTATGDLGITHQKTFEWPQAGGVSLTFHAGFPVQSANAELRNLSENMRFKVQRDYYTGTGLKTAYWSDNHRLLDTAYVVSKDFIAEEDGKAPEHSYVVKGKFINCYNYDGTYKAITGYSSFNSYNIGDEVTVTLADGSSSAAEIVEMFDFYDLNSIKDGRIKIYAQDPAINDALLKNTAGRITLSKAGAPDWIMQSDSFTGSSTNPVNIVDPVNPVTPISNLTPTKLALNTGAISTTLSRTARKEFEEICIEEGQGEERCSWKDVYYYTYIVDLSFLTPYTKDLIKSLKEVTTDPVITLVLTRSASLTESAKTSRFEIPMRFIDTVNWRIREGADNHLFGRFFDYFPGTNPTAGVEETVYTNISVDLSSNFAIVKDSQDTLEVSNGLTVTIQSEDVENITRTVIVPETPALASFLSTNNIIIFSREYPYDITNSTYSYGSRTTNVPTTDSATPTVLNTTENTIFGDLRVSINPAMQLLDYLTSNRYGKGLSLDLIDLESFKETARACDEGSDVTVLVSSSVTAPTIGSRYQYPDNGPVQFRGTVLSTEILSSSEEGSEPEYRAITFTDVAGKLGYKWLDWKSYKIDTPVWHLDVDTSNGNTVVNFGFVPTEGTVNKPTTNTGSISLYEVEGSRELVLDTFLSSPEGNPFVKTLDATGVTLSGYSLYDSDDVKYWKYIGWDSHDQKYVTRHQTNMTVDTSQPVFDNVNDMLSQFNGMLRYSNGKYSLSLRTKAKPIDSFDEAIEVISPNEIIGEIKLDDKGISKTYNSITAGILDPFNDFEPRSISFFNSDYLKQDKRVQRQGNYQAGGISNYFNARLNIKQVLDESRAGLTVSFKMAPKGYLLLPGNIIALNYPKFNWDRKLFRISSLNVQDDLLIQVVATEHNDNAYIIDNLPSSIIEKYSSTSNSKPITNFSPPTLLTPSTEGRGGIVLSWTNASNFNRASHTTQIWRSTTSNFNDADLIGYSKSDTFTDAVTDGGSLTRYYWIRYSILQDSNSSKTGQPIENFSVYSPLEGESGLGGTALPVESAVNVSIISSNGGTVFKNNEGTEKILSVVAFDAGTGLNITNNITKYEWLRGGDPVYVDSNNRIVPFGTENAIRARGDFPNIIVGPEDIEDGSSEFIEVEITL